MACRPHATRVTTITAARPRPVLPSSVSDRCRRRNFPTAQALNSEAVMLWTIFIILLVLWLLGMVSSYTLGGFIHVLLVVAIVIALIQLIQGRRVM
jgi:hypothetical protein